VVAFSSVVSGAEHGRRRRAGDDAVLSDASCGATVVATRVGQEAAPVPGGAELEVPMEARGGGRRRSTMRSLQLG
jgi:hypothetical protein